MNGFAPSGVHCAHRKPSTAAAQATRRVKPSTPPRRAMQHSRKRGRDSTSEDTLSDDTNGAATHDSLPSSPMRRSFKAENDSRRYFRATKSNKVPPKKSAKLVKLPAHREKASLLRCADLCKRDGVVWAKTTGYPFWPAQVVRLDARVTGEERYKLSLRIKRRDDDTCVMYFGTQQFAWVNKRTCVVSWEKGIEKNLHVARAGGTAYERALRDAYRYSSDKTFYPRRWWCEPRCFVLADDLIEIVRANEFLYYYRDSMVRAEKERVCWIQTRGCPHPWPAQIMLPDFAARQYPDLSVDPKVPIAHASSWACMMFGTGEVAIAVARDITPLVAGVRRDFHEVSRDPKFLAALGDLWGYLKYPREWPSGIFAHQPWWDDNRDSFQSVALSAKSPPPFPKFTELKESQYLPGVQRPKKPDESALLTCLCKMHDVKREGELCNDDDCMNIASRLFCDPELCEAGSRCVNRKFSERRQPKVKPFYTADDRGWGLRLEENVEKGDFIIEYVGEIIDQERLHKRLAAKKEAAKNDYYIMEIGPGLYVDSEKKGNLARFMNSSCDPNCISLKWTEQRTGETHVGLFATRDLKVGTELTFNYGFEDFGMMGKIKERSFSCRCGAANCNMMNDQEREHVQKLMGKKIEVQWDCGMYYKGKVTNYDTNAKRFKVVYVDGDVELLSLDVPTALKGGDGVCWRTLD